MRRWRRAGRRPADRRRVPALCDVVRRLPGHKGIPARARVGFANYFQPGKNVDHWVGEYWSTAEQRWILVDAQVDEHQAKFYKPDFDLLDVPRDRFRVAGDAWHLPEWWRRSDDVRCRWHRQLGDRGGARRSLLDLAALQKIELLPWGWYGLAEVEGACDAEAELIDRLAGLSSAADADALEELRRMVAADARLAVPAETLAAIARGGAGLLRFCPEQANEAARQWSPAEVIRPPLRYMNLLAIRWPLFFFFFFFFFFPPCSSLEISEACLMTPLTIYKSEKRDAARPRECRADRSLLDPCR